MRFFLVIMTILTLALPAVCADIPVKGKFSIEYRKSKRKAWSGVCDEYQRNSKDSQKVKTQVLKLINDYADNVCMIKGFRSMSDIGDDGRKIAIMDPTDPFAKAITGMAILYGGNDRVSDFLVADGLLRDGVKGLKNTQYSVLIKMLAARWLRETLVRSRKMSGADEKKILTDYVKAAYEWLSVNHPEDQDRFTFEVLALRDFIKTNIGNDVKKRFIEQVASSTKIKPWLKDITLGVFHSYRSRYYSLDAQYKRVKDPIGFSGHRKLAVKHLKSAQKMYPDRPEAATELIMVSRFGGTSEPPRHWFDLAVKAEVDYFPAYYNLLGVMLNAGSYKDMVAFGKECVATGRYDTSIPAAYVVAVELISINVTPSAFRQMNLYPGLHKVLRKYEKQQEKGLYTSRTKGYMKAIHFCCAFRSNKFDHAVKLHKLYGRDIYSVDVFKQFNLEFSSAVSFAYAMIGPASKMVAELDTKLNWESSLDKGPFKWRSAKEVDALISKLKKAQSLTKAKEARPYFNKLRALLETEKKFNDGDWVKLTFPKDLSTWHVYGGHFDVENDHTILASNTGSQVQYISSNAYFKPPYSVEVEVESISSNWRGRHLHAGIMCGRMFGPGAGRIFWVDGLRRRTGVGAPGEPPMGTDLKSMGRKNKIRVNVWSGHYELIVNDVDIPLALPPGQNLQRKKFEPMRLSLGMMPWYSSSGVVRYSNVRIRKLDFGPPPAKNAANAQELITYYEKRLKQRKSHAFFGILGTAYQSIARRENSMKLYEKSYSYFCQAAELDDTCRYPFCASKIAEELRKYDALHKLYPEIMKRSKGDRVFVRFEPMVLNDYAWFLATCPIAKYRDGAKAVTLAKKAIKKYPRYAGQYLGTLSAALATNGDFAGAVSVAEKLLKRAPKHEKQWLLHAIKLYKKRKIYLTPPERTE